MDFSKMFWNFIYWDALHFSKLQCIYERESRLVSLNMGQVFQKWAYTALNTVLKNVVNISNYIFLLSSLSYLHNVFDVYSASAKEENKAVNLIS